MVLEAQALLNVLRAVEGKIKGERVDAKVDNMSLYHAYYNEGCKSRELNRVLKEIFYFVLERDLVLNLEYVKSENNLADAPSRVLKKTDATISRKTWELIQQAFGGPQGHSLDMMALDSNCMVDKKGDPLKHFTPFWTPGSKGINVFTQQISQEENCYVFPPFNLLLPIIGFIKECKIDCTVVVPAYDITPIWLPLVAGLIQDALILGWKKQKGVLLYPSKKKGYSPDKFGLPWNLWALRIRGGNRIEHDTLGKFLFLTGSNKINASGLLGVGDSMIRYFEQHEFFQGSMAGIISKGGAVVHEVATLLRQCLGRFRPGIIFIHAGVNNLSKTYLYKNEIHQMSCAKFELAVLENILSSYVSESLGTRVILSSVTATKDGRINARAKYLNDYIEQCCVRNKWCFMDDRNIGTEDLRDAVHLNKLGEEKFLSNLRDSIREIA